MSDHVQVPCGSCAGVVRVPASRMHENPRCPRCHTALFTGKPIDVNEAVAFDHHLTRSDLPLVVDFWAPWCGPCQMMAPTLERAAAQLKSRIRFLKVNTDEVAEVAGRFGIRSIPTLIVFVAGRERARVSGALSAQQLEQWLEQALTASHQGAQRASS